jgi:hypothetical protein
LVEPTCGELLVDDVNVLNLPLHELRNNIAIVPQVILNLIAMFYTAGVQPCELMFWHAHFLTGTNAVPRVGAVQSGPL